MITNIVVFMMSLIATVQFGKNLWSRWTARKEANGLTPNDNMMGIPIVIVSGEEFVKNTGGGMALAGKIFVTDRYYGLLVAVFGGDRAKNYIIAHEAGHVMYRHNILMTAMVIVMYLTQMSILLNWQGWGHYLLTTLVLLVSIAVIDTLIELSADKFACRLLDITPGEIREISFGFNSKLTNIVWGRSYLLGLIYK